MLCQVSGYGYWPERPNLFRYGIQSGLSYNAWDGDVSGNWSTAVKAIRAHSFGGPEVLQLETVEAPVDGPGEVVVEVRAAGVDPEAHHLAGPQAAPVGDAEHDAGLQAW